MASTPFSGQAPKQTFANMCVADVCICRAHLTCSECLLCPCLCCARTKSLLCHFGCALCAPVARALDWPAVLRLTAATFGVCNVPTMPPVCAACVASASRPMPPTCASTACGRRRTSRRASPKRSSCTSAEGACGACVVGLLRAQVVTCARAPRVWQGVLPPAVNGTCPAHQHACVFHRAHFRDTPAEWAPLPVFRYNRNASWVVAQQESPQLLAVCLKKINGLQKVRLVNAEFIWTEPHSKRLKVNLTVQKEVRCCMQWRLGCCA